MKIGIDARLIQETGVGRYIRNLIGELGAQDSGHEYVVFLSPKSYDSFTLPSSRWKKVLAPSHWHTLSEQIRMPQLFASEHLDLLHVPYHNPPVLYSGRMVITIHDLTILHFATGKATTLPLPLYYLKRLGYWLELWIGLRRARHIIAVSEATKREIMDHFRIPASKITVTYEGVDPSLMNRDASKEKRLMNEPYFLYVGNAYPHKNIQMLLEGFRQFMDTQKPAGACKLVLVGADDFFYRQVNTRVHEMGLSPSVVFFGPANDAQLISLYTHASAFVFPSLMEGFGLPALEAVSLGCIVCVSDIPVFHEILGSHAVYFDPNSSGSLAKALTDIAAKSGTDMRPKAHDKKFLSAFSWKRMAEETQSIYERSIRL
jgi:glycosyltransferase involved in cell wall biosynthesis